MLCDAEASNKTALAKRDRGQRKRLNSMAINRQPREDLMKEATAYDRRVKLRDAGAGEIFVGLRAQRGWSIYFGEDPVFQFNTESQLRRVHFNEQNYAAENGKLLLLQRSQVGGHVELMRTFSEAAQQKIRRDCLNRLGILLGAIEQRSIEVLDQFPADENLLRQVEERLREVVRNYTVATVPHATQSG